MEEFERPKTRIAGALIRIYMTDAKYAPDTQHLSLSDKGALRAISLIVCDIVPGDGLAAW